MTDQTPPTVSDTLHTMMAGTSNTTREAHHVCDALDAAAFASPALAVVARRLLTRPADVRRFERSEAQPDPAALRDYEFTDDFARCRPDLAFDRLRWGGQLVYVAPTAARVQEMLGFYRGKPEWEVEGAVQSVALPRLAALRRLPRWAFPGMARRFIQCRAHYGVVRKVLLDPVSRLTSRHSYDVRLAHVPKLMGMEGAEDGWVVLKRVPTVEHALSRLVQTCPGLEQDRLEQIAAKLVNKVFPVFLTREAAFLKLIQRDLPPELRCRAPRLLDMETDARGLVRSMSLRWLRMGGEPMSQIEFARQAAEVLRGLHESAGILHLDLRLDNIIVTPQGVGLVDFGSSVRVGEQVAANPMIDTLLREMLCSSQVTADLNRQRAKGFIQSRLFDGLPYPPSPAFDLYALVTGMTRPHDHPDFVGLVTFDRHGEEAQTLSRLRRSVLHPDRDKLGVGSVSSVHDLCVALGVEAPRPARGGGKSLPHGKPRVLDGPSMPVGGRAMPQVNEDSATQPSAMAG